MFKAALFIIIKTWKQPRCPWVGGGINKQWSIHSIPQWNIIQQWKDMEGAFLVAQWLRVLLPMQGTQVRFLVWEDPTCCRATKPMHHNYWACALEPMSHNYWAHMPQLLKPVRLEPVLRNKRSHHSKKPTRCNKESPPLAATRESPRAATKTQHSQK